MWLVNQYVEVRPRLKNLLDMTSFFIDGADLCADVTSTRMYPLVDLEPLHESVERLDPGRGSNYILGTLLSKDANLGQSKCFVVGIQPAFAETPYSSRFTLHKKLTCLKTAYVLR